MLVLREDQKRALGEAREWVYRERLARHLRRFFPRLCQELGEAGLGETVGYGIERARAHGFVSEGHLCKYVSLMLVFGRDFDRAPGLEWAATILASEDPPGRRMGRLWTAALAWRGADRDLEAGGGGEAP